MQRGRRILGVAISTLLAASTIHVLAADVPTLAEGEVATEWGNPVPAASVALTLKGPDGQPIWILNLKTDERGHFSVDASDLALDTGGEGRPQTYVGTVAASARGYATTELPVRVDWSRGPSGDTVRFRPARLLLRLPAYSGWLTALVLLPAVFGLILAVAHFSGWAASLRVSRSFAFGAAGLWSVVIAIVAAEYARTGQFLLPLFWNDLFGAAGTVVFAFIGTVCYVAYSLYQREPGEVEEMGAEERRKLLLTLGGRVLIAPYVALVAQGVLASSFPSLRAGAFSMFLGFFTGLWIKPVLEALNDIGKRFLSLEQRQKLVDRMKREEATAAAAERGTEAVIAPESASLEALGRARKELLPKRGVLGVDLGLKVSSEEPGVARSALVVYVSEKATPSDAADAVPERLEGFATDVVEVPSRSNDGCRGAFSRLSWAKVHQDTQDGQGVLPAAPSAVRVIESGITLLVDAPPYQFFRPAQPDKQRIFDVIGAYKAAGLADQVDFATFIVDPRLCDALEIFPGAYHVPVRHDILGTNYERVMRPYADLAAWGTQRLRACTVAAYGQVAGTSPHLSLWVHLHELAHYWSAYVTLPPPHEHDLLAGAEGQGLFHWGRQFDSGFSCVDADESGWKELPDGGFEVVPLRYEGEDRIQFCELELYLMGLMPPSKVGPLRVLRNLQSLDGKRYRADVATASIDDVIAVCGERSPSWKTADKAFTQAFIVVSGDEQSGRALAGQVASFGKEYVEAFHRATRNLATLKLVPAS
jgi:hypothetical protein